MTTRVKKSKVTSNQLQRGVHMGAVHGLYPSSVQESDVSRPSRARTRPAPRDPLLAAASHELANPLLALVVSLELAAGKVRSGQVSSDWLLERMDRMVRTARHAQQLAHCFLEIGSPLELRRAHTRKIELRSFCQEMIDEMSEQLSASGCEVNLVGGPFECRVSTVPLKQVLWNLLSNASKYAPGAPIDVELSHEDDRLEIRVSDRGEGLGGESMFEAFERGSNPTGAAGTGLGLFIVRELIQSMGGHIHWSPRAGGGTSFLIQLPLEEGPLV